MAMYWLLFLCLLTPLQFETCVSERVSATDLTIEAFRQIFNRQSLEKETKNVNYGENAQPQVQTTSGLIYGVNNSYSYAFHSIPFAVPPTGELRFQPPQMLDSPGARRNLSLEKPVSCAQLKNYQEDCLVLSVNVPTFVDLLNCNSPPTDRLPVLFFIHGGAFFAGSETESIYDGRYLSEATSTIVVATNYRLGPLGFLAYNDGETAFDGNQGLKDQRLALQWVQNNIEQFGGDKTKVTVFGESAGAQSVMFHLVSKSSDPLFRSGIMESNPAIYRYPTVEQSLELTRRYVETLRCSELNTENCCLPSKSDYTCLMEATAEELISGASRVGMQDLVQLEVVDGIEPFRPYIDGEEFLRQPLLEFEDGNWNKQKPVIIGTNKEELDIIKYKLPDSKLTFLLMNQLLFDEIEEGMGDRISHKYMEAYPNVTDFSQLFGMEMTHIWFTCPSRALARFASATTENSVYYYVFDHALDGEDCEEYIGNLCEHSFHGSELVFVFKTIQHVGMIPDDEDILVSNQFSTYWGNMAWRGFPSQGPGFGLEGEFPDWLKYTETFEQNSEPWTNIRLAEPIAYLEADYLGDICGFWDNLELYPAPLTKIQPLSTNFNIGQTDC